MGNVSRIGRVEADPAYSSDDKILQEHMHAPH